MRYFILLFTFIAFNLSRVEAQQPEIIKLPKLISLLNPESDTTYVINFWATWCKPCVKEIPYFEKLSVEKKDEKVKVLLLSLDFRRQYETNLVPFIKKNQITTEVMMIDEPDYDKWIDKVDPSWSGAIPSTIVINSSKNVRNFYEKDFTYTELKNIVEPLISK